MQLSIDIVLDVSQYLDPQKLDKLAESSKWWRCIVNSMNKSAYIAKWLCVYKNNLDSYTYTISIEHIVTELTNKWYFKLLCNDINTYHKLCNNIIDKRLYICILDLSIDNEYLKRLSGIHSICFKDCTNIRDLSFLNNSYMISIHSCRYTFPDHILDVSSLGDIYTIILSGSIYFGINSLGRLHNIYLGVQFSSDVSMLGGVHTLYLSHCKIIEDVSMLGSIYNLNLYGCDGIGDLSNLSGVSNLNLTKCGWIGDIDSLGSVDNINLSWCYVKDVSSLGAVKYIKLRGCEYIEDVSMLGGVHVLYIKLCSGIKGIYYLDSINTLIKI